MTDSEWIESVGANKGLTDLVGVFTKSQRIEFIYVDKSLYQLKGRLNPEKQLKRDYFILDGCDSETGRHKLLAVTPKDHIWAHQQGFKNQGGNIK